MRSLRAVAVAALLAAGVLAAPATSPAPVAGVGSLPACRLDDILTEPRGYDEWATTLVDWILTLGPAYKPPDLVSVRESGIAGGGYIRKVAIDDLTALVSAAKQNGTPLVSWSPYRSYRQQVKLFNGYAGWTGTKYTNFDRAINYSARPGHSEHQTGLTIDFVAVGDHGLTSNWQKTPTGGWMARHAWEFGWVMSYPKGKQDVVCYSYEPWHYRYFGRELAARIHDSGLTPREYLWANFTQVDPNCVVLPAPSLGGPPRSCALPAVTESPSATVVGPSPAASPFPGSSLPPAGPLSPLRSPTPTAGPSAATAGALFGLDPAVLVGLVILLGGGAALAWFSRARRRGSRP